MRWPPADATAAYDLAERSLYDSLMARGRQGAVLEWLGPHAGELNRRPRLLPAVAWSLALSRRHEDAARCIGPPAAATRWRCGAAVNAHSSAAALRCGPTTPTASPLPARPWAERRR